MKIKPIHGQSRGFSLVELMMVIAVIGAIAAISIPALAGVFNDSTTAKNKRNAQSIATLYSGARGAGATFSSTATEGIVNEILAGKTGAGGLTGSIFKSPLSDTEAALTLPYLNYDSTAQQLVFNSEANSAGAQTPPAPTAPERTVNPAYQEWWDMMERNYASVAANFPEMTFDRFKADFSNVFPPPPQYL